jgi:hypothetical protein
VKPRYTLIVVAVLAALLVYLYMVELPQTPEQINARLGTPTVTPAPYMFQLDAANVKTFTIADMRFPRTVTVVRADSGWLVTQPENKPADKNKADAVAAALTKIKIGRAFTNVTNPANYGLAPATLEARFDMTDGTTYAFLLGNKTPDGMNFYAAYTGDLSKVFLLENSLGVSLINLIDVPPFEPTPMPTPTVTPPVTPTVGATPIPPGFVPTLLPTPVGTPKP